MKDESVIGRLFVDLSKDYIAQVTKRLEDGDIDKHHYPLYVLDQSESTLTQTELAEALQTDKVSVVRMVDYLTEAGYVERQVDTKDRRKQHVILLPKAEEILPSIREAIKAADANILDILDEQDRADFMRISAVLRNHYHENPTNQVKVSLNYKRVKK